MSVWLGALIAFMLAVGCGAVAYRLTDYVTGRLRRRDR